MVGAELADGATLSADAGYFSADNVRITIEHGLDPHIATGRFKHGEPPAPSPRGRIPKDATPKQLMARKLKTKNGRRVYSRRKTIVEPVFGQMTTTQNARKLLLRGKDAARAQWRLSCAVHNLLKLHRNGGLAKTKTTSKRDTSPAGTASDNPYRHAETVAPHWLARHLLPRPPIRVSVLLTDPRSRAPPGETPSPRQRRAWAVPPHGHLLFAQVRGSVWSGMVGWDGPTCGGSPP